jgi:hypothetical protein
MGLMRNVKGCVDYEKNNYRVSGNHCTAPQKVQPEQEANRAREAIGI